MADFSGADVQSIEEALERHRPGAWRRLKAADLEQISALIARAGWSLAVPVGQYAHERVDRLLLIIDRAFPKSEPRVIVPSLKLGEWPHVEKDGVLCLRRTSWGASAGDRAITSTADASSLLNYDEPRRRQEFAREFSAYWAQLLSQTEAGPLFMTLTASGPPTREVFFARLSKGARIILGDNPDSVGRWLDHRGESVDRRVIQKTLLHWLPEPWMPAEYPHKAQNVLAKIDRGALNPFLRPGESLPVLFGATTVSGPVFVGIEMPSVPSKQFRNGFRANHVPGSAVAMFSASQPIHRCRVERVDPSWIHGRDHDPQQALLAAKCVGIIGCGSLGAPVARLLAQMGIGSFVLVDSDELSAANTSRHILGLGYIRQNKAAATRKMLLLDFPQLTGVECFEVRVQSLTDENLRRLAACDVIVSAGIDLAGDAVLDQWRRALTNPPVHVATWVEEYALAGHAVALFGDDSLFARFSPEGVPDFRLTQWPPEAKSLIVEAGCGNSFQPHGVIDLNNSVGMAATLVLDVLAGVLAHTHRRAWLGSREQVIRDGGTPTAGFDASNTVKEFEWATGEG
jgi:hypothetical protein